MDVDLRKLLHVNRKPLPHRLDDPQSHPAKIPIPTGPDKWYEFALSYKNAADCLATSMVKSNSQSSVVAPMMFLYRHYLELHLKCLLKEAGEALDDPQQIPPRHYLLSLWQRVRPLLVRMAPKADDPSLARADEVIAQMDSFDSASFAFRYPVDKSGGASLSSAISVHPLNVKVVIEELHELLDGASLFATTMQLVKSLE